MKDTKTQPIIGKPETWPKKIRTDACLCGKSIWHVECYKAVPLINGSVRSIFAHVDKSK